MMCPESAFTAFTGRTFGTRPAVGVGAPSPGTLP